MNKQQAVRMGNRTGMRWLLLCAGVVFLLIYASGHVQSYTEATTYERAIHSIKEKNWPEAQRLLQEVTDVEDAKTLLIYVQARREMTNGGMGGYAAALSSLHKIPDDYQGDLYEEVTALKRDVQAAWQLELKKAQTAQDKRPAPKVGMTREQVRTSSWGAPKYINRTETENGVVEQWVYPAYRFVYVENGKVTIVRP
ncbi:hypothetical protein [Aneurinibacillus sp. REN35]|uniref:hypothetical protein n=1 Tax=Aneurinibacillus sp. REN35 TaxID=3237286 RepID=UPI00352910C8